MRLLDWRDVDASLLAGEWAGQSARWTARLAWDSTANWSAVEAQRQAGRLPGLVLLDGTLVAGWSFFLVHQDTLQIGGFEADGPASTSRLLDAVLASAGPEIAPAGTMIFAFSGAPELSAALTARGFDVDPYLHFVRDLHDVPAPGETTTWRADAAERLPLLLARSYGGPTLTRPFARRGLMAEWCEYAAQLLGSTACGTFEPGLSASLVAADGSLDAAIVTTVVGPRTAHIAQVAVDPARRASGIAATMLRDVIGKAGRAGFERISLLVSERNTAALRLYQRHGFIETARFVSAGRAAEAVEPAAAYPRRSTRPAFETGGASTRR